MFVIEDVDAELNLVACAVASPQGSDLAHQRVTVDQLTRPYLQRLFAATPHLARRPPDFTVAESWDQPGLCDQRVREAAEAAGVLADDVTLLVARRLSMTDSQGYWAGRVTDAATRRQAAGDLETIAHDLAAGEDPDVVATALRLTALLLEVA